MPLDPENRLVLVAHQFVTGAARCESEELSVGGADNVDAEVFAPFDYVALGHLHAAQRAGRAAVRYCGSPLKYSFAEASGEKSVTVVELAGKGEAQISEIPLAPKREMREVRGNYMDVTSRSFYEKFGRDDYFRVTLTDEDDVPDALQKLRAVYPNLMRLDYDNRRSRAGGVAGLAKVEKFSPIRIFEMLYEERNGRELSETQRDYLAKLMAEVWEDAG